MSKKGEKQTPGGGQQSPTPLREISKEMMFFQEISREEISILYIYTYIYIYIYIKRRDIKRRETSYSLKRCHIVLKR